MRKPSERYFASLGSGKPVEVEIAALDEDRLRVTLPGSFRRAG
jgi:hypothetical protein